MPYKMKHTHRTLLSVIIATLVIGIGGFVVRNVHDSLFGAPLSINTALDGTTLSDGFLPVAGNAKHARSVLINGRTVPIDRSGHFADAVLLSPGYNVVEVALYDQFGGHKVRTYHFVLDESGAVARAGAEDNVRHQ